MKAVDLIVVAHGDSPHLRACIESLMSQKAKRPVALSVATSTPTKAMRWVCELYGLRLDVNHSAAGGIGADWSYAYQCGSSDLLTLCHQDDVYEPGYVEQVASLFDRCEDLRFACSDHVELVDGHVRAPSSTLLVKRALMYYAFGNSPVADCRARRRRLLAWGNPVSCPSVMFNRAAMPDFRFSHRLRSNLDWDAWDRLCSTGGSMGYTRARLVAHRVHAESATTALIRDQVRAREDLEMMKRFWPAPVAHMLSYVYRLSYRSNTVADDDAKRQSSRRQELDRSAE